MADVRQTIFDVDAPLQTNYRLTVMLLTAFGAYRGFYVAWLHSTFQSDPKLYTSCVTRVACTLPTL